MTGMEEYALPQPTDRTVDGPRLTMARPRLVVEYDYEHDDGSVTWTRVVFDTVLCFEYRRDPCCSVEDIEGYNRIVRYLDSDWLKEMKARLRRLGPVVTDEELAGYSDWRIYFDDSGCVAVIAMSCEVDAC